MLYDQKNEKEEIENCSIPYYGLMQIIIDSFLGAYYFRTVVRVANGAPPLFPKDFGP